MPLRTGIDVTHISRVRRLIEGYGDHFKQRFFPRHLAKFGHDDYNHPETYAGMWAAKEAVFKVLGRGNRWTYVFIDHESSGRPRARIDEELLSLPGVGVPTGAEWDVTITHDGDLAIAFAACFWIENKP